VIFADAPHESVTGARYNSVSTKGRGATTETLKHLAPGAYLSAPEADIGTGLLNVRFR